MGLEFAQHLQEFAESKGVTTGSVGKIAQNPTQSKHLETATLKLFGLDIDLVNLRSEEYANDSRIPTEVVGNVEYTFILAYFGSLDIWNSVARCS